MKVWKRILVKVLLFVVLVGGAGTAGIARRAGSQATAEYALNRYAEHLIGNEMEKAYPYLDQSGDIVLSAADFTKAAEAKKYGLYAGYRLEKLESRRDDAGNEFEDYKITFVNTDDEVQAEETITAKKQAEKRFFFFDEWLVVPDHCLVKNFTFTVPAGSSVILDGKNADAWLTENTDQKGKNQYCVPEILPGKIRVQIHHPIFDAVVTEMDTTEQNVDLCRDMQLSEDGKAACFEAGVKILRELYTGTVKESASQLSDIFAPCQERAKELMDQQQQILTEKSEAGSGFQSLAVSGFNPRYGEIVYSEEEDGIQVEMSMAYHYLGKFRTTVMVETGEYDEDGYPIAEESTREDSVSGDSTAKLTLSYYDNAWHLTEMDIPLILQE